MAINSDEINVMTVEDPVEYTFPTINQISIQEQAGVTFAAGLRSILRQDPDAILVGEIRDVETARIAIQAALTGHFVLSTIHATDATSALHRFLDMGIESFLLASSMLAVVGQRLIRRNCPECLEEYEPSVEDLAFYERAGGQAARRSSSTVAAARSAPAPATPAGSACTRSSSSPTRCVTWWSATRRSRRSARWPSTRAWSRCEIRRCGWSPTTSRLLLK